MIRKKIKKRMFEKKITGRKILAAVCAASALFMSVAASAEGIPLKKYDEQFEYKSEIMAYALKTAVCRVNLYVTGEITYSQPVLNRNERELENIVRAYAETTNSVTVDGFIDWLKENPELLIVAGTTKTQSFNDLLAAHGSGVVISEDGYIATNEHVVTVDEGEIYASLFGNYLLEDVKALLNEFPGYFGENVSLTDEELDNWYDYIVTWAAKRARVSDMKKMFKVVFPDKNGNTDSGSAVEYVAEIIKEGDNETVNNNEDGAIIKIDADNLVALEVLKDCPSEGEKIWAAGFPGTSNLGYSSDSTYAITITDGQISRVNTDKEMKYNVLEITAHVSGGNSGGPSVDSRLAVCGLNTFVSSDDASRQWMVSPQLIWDLASGLPIGQGDISKTYLLGLQALQKGYGKTAKDCFNEVSRLNPNTPYINELIKEASKQPDKSMGIVFDQNMLILIICGVLGAAAIAVIIVVISSSRKRRRRPVIADPVYDNSDFSDMYLTGGNTEIESWGDDLL